MKLRHLFAGSAPAFALALALAPLSAQAKPMHMSVQIKPTACGAQITCVAKSDSSAYGQAIVGLVAAANVNRVTRDSARKTLARVSVATPSGHAVPVVINVPYGPGFAPGAQFHVVSAWPYGGSAHVWGAVTTTSTANLVTLPTPTGKDYAKKAQAARAAAKVTAQANKAKLAALKTTQRAAITDLKAKHKAGTVTMKATHTTQVQRLKATAQARRDKLQVRLAAAPAGAKKAQVRALLTQDANRARQDLANLKYRQTSGLRTLAQKQASAQATLASRHGSALTKLETRLASF